jgi:hypothetical protein
MSGMPGVLTDGQQLIVLGELGVAALLMLASVIILVRDAAGRPSSAMKQPSSVTVPLFAHRRRRQFWISGVGGGAGVSLLLLNYLLGKADQKALQPFWVHAVALLFVVIAASLFASVISFRCPGCEAWLGSQAAASGPWSRIALTLRLSNCARCGCRLT